MNSFLFKQLRENWSNFIIEPGIDRFNIDINERFQFLKYFEGSDIAYTIINNISFEIEHYSKIFFEVLGLDENEFKKYRMATFTEAVPKNQASFFTLLPKYFQEYWQGVDSDIRHDIIRTTAGLSFNHKEKGLIRLILQTYILEVNSFQAPTYLFILFHNVTYMMKDDFYWIRFANLDKTGNVLVYHDGFKEVLKDDIISCREKEILELIIDSKSPEEIADILFISKNTVNNHRQNMLNRTGVKDTTALIDLCRLCHVI